MKCMAYEGHWRRICVHTIALSIIACAPPVYADDYPARPVTFVVAFGVGGSADRMTRTMSPFIGEALGQPVHVINRRGAGTLLAANYILEQPHDGYTVFATGFSPYLSNTILEGNANYTIDDFAYLNFQWFDEDLIALHRGSKYTNLPELLEDIRDNPKTVRAAVAGGVVDFIVISAAGTEGIREYIRPLAIVSHQRNPEWDAPTLTQAMAPTGIEVPVLPGSIRGYGTSAEFKRQFPERFRTLASALQAALGNDDLIALLDGASIGRRWIGPDASEDMMRETFAIFRDYSYLLKE